MGFMTMKCTYELNFVASCPVDDTIDTYVATVVSDRMRKVEDILEIVRRYKDVKIFQEDVTAELARDLNATVTTVGYHSGVKTTVTAEPK